MGDFNINLHKNSLSNQSCEYEQILLNSNFSPLISTITHEIPGCKASCIDNIHTNDHNNVLILRTLENNNVLILRTLENRLSHHNLGTRSVSLQASKYAISARHF